MSTLTERVAREHHRDPDEAFDAPPRCVCGYEFDPSVLPLPVWRKHIAEVTAAEIAAQIRELEYTREQHDQAIRSGMTEEFVFGYDFAVENAARIAEG